MGSGYANLAERTATLLNAPAALGVDRQAHIAPIVAECGEIGWPLAAVTILAILSG